MKLFKSNYTNWIPFGVYDYGSQHYMVFIRKNKKTGMLHFRTKKVQRSFWVGNFLPTDLINVKEQWDLINNM